jgi:hypothetical protein
VTELLFGRRAEGNVKTLKGKTRTIEIGGERESYPLETVVRIDSLLRKVGTQVLEGESVLASSITIAGA